MLMEHIQKSVIEWGGDIHRFHFSVAIIIKYMPSFLLLSFFTVNTKLVFNDNWYEIFSTVVALVIGNDDSDDDDKNYGVDCDNNNSSCSGDSNSTCSQ